MARITKKSFELESALTELNRLVEQMEQGGLTLEQSLQHFEDGIKLVRLCQDALKTAEQKVQILLEQDGKIVLQAYQLETEQ